MGTETQETGSNGDHAHEFTGPDDVCHVCGVERPRWPTITMAGCEHCGLVAAVPRKRISSYQHWCEPRKDFIFGGLVAVEYAPLTERTEVAHA